MMNWVTMVGGVALFLAPFTTGYTGNPAALWTSLIMGGVIAVLGYRQNYQYAAIAGLMTFAAPGLLGFSGVGAATWCCVVIGLVVAIYNGYYGFYKQSGGSKSVHA